MRFPHGLPERPNETPYLRKSHPYCSSCTDDLVWDDDHYVCPRCGSSFKGDDDGPGMPYPEWSGEPYADEASSGAGTGGDA